MTINNSYTLLEATKKIGCESGDLMEYTRRGLIHPFWPYQRIGVVSQWKDCGSSEWANR